MAKTLAADLDMAYIENAIAAYGGIAERRKGDPARKIDARYYELLTNILVEYREGVLQGKKSFGYVGSNPVALLQHGFDVAPCPETQIRSSSLIFNDGVDKAMAVAEEFGLTSEVCSGQRVEVGGSLLGWTPRATAYVGSVYCDGGIKMAEFHGKVTNRPYYHVDRTWAYNEIDLRYLRRELEGLVDFMENITGQRIDWDKVAQAVKYDEQVRELQTEINELRSAVPSPLRNRTPMYLMVLATSYTGRPEAVEFWKMVRDEAKERVSVGRGAVPHEKLRLVMYVLPPQWNWRLLDWMEEECGAVIVAEPCNVTGNYGKLARSGDDVLSAIQAWVVNNPYYWQFCGPVDIPVQEVVKTVSKTRADGLIIFSQSACVSVAGTFKMVKDAISEQVGIPCCTVEYDLLDRTTKGMNSLKADLEIFFEMLTERKEENS